MTFKECSMKKTKNNILADDALIREVSEDVKNDQMKELWNKYGLFVVIFIALAITAAVSFETFKSWMDKRNQEVSNAFAVAISLQNQGKFDDSLKILQKLSEKSSIYSDIARLQMANIYFEQKNNKAGVEQLEFLVSDKCNNNQMKEIAILKLAAYKLDNNAPSTEIKELLTPLAEKENGTYNVARELLAMLAIRDGNLEDAKAGYELIAASANGSDALKSRALDMINILNDKNM